MPSSSRPLLAIDYGTSNTVAMVRTAGDEDRSLLFGSSPVMPSAVFLDEEGRFHTGHDAHRMAQLDPASFEPHPKQRIGEDLLLLGEREVRVTDLVAAVLDRIARAAEEVAGTVPPVVLTRPVRWGHNRVAVLEQAAREAGLEIAGVVSEPVAAAHRFTEVEHAVADAPIAVFDLGGGTCDVAVLRPEPYGRFDIAAQGGLAQFGGVDLDHALVSHLGILIGERHSDLWRRISRPSSTQDRRARRQFWDDVRDAKEMVSRSPMAPVAIPGIDSALHLTRDEVEQIAAPFLEQTAAVTRQVIAEAGCRPSDLAGLFLVGGASRMPLVARLLHQRLGIAPSVLEQPETAVVRGALDALDHHSPLSAASNPTGHDPKASPSAYEYQLAEPAPSPTGTPSSAPPIPAAPAASVRNRSARVAIAATALTGVIALVIGMTWFVANRPDGTGDGVTEDWSGGSPGILTVCTDAQFAPFASLQGGEYVGFEMDLMRLLAERLGHDLRVVEFDFQDLWNGARLNAGACDITAAAMAITEERREYMEISDPYFRADHALVAAPGSGITGLADLDGARVATRLFTSASDFADSVAEQHGFETHTFDEVEAMATALSQGQVEVAVTDIAGWSQMVSAAPDLALIDTIAADEYFGFAVAKDDTELLAEVNRMLDEALDDGTYAELYEYWFDAPYTRDSVE